MTASAKIAFQVAEVLKDSEGTKVLGRCCEGPICKGDIFDVIYDILPQVQGGRYVPSTRYKLGSVRITVKGLFSYGHEVDRFDPGLSGTILIGGQGIELLQKDCFLGVDDLMTRDQN